MNTPLTTPYATSVLRLGRSRIRAFVRFSLILVCVLLSATLLPAKILKTKHLRRGLGMRLPLTIGSAFEYQADSEEKEYGFPFYAEWKFTEALQLSIEPNYLRIKPKTAASVKGWGDIEACLIYEFSPETRRRPAFSIETIINIPLTTNTQLGTTGRVDFTIGGIVSRELGPVDLDLNVDYTFVGSPPDVHLKNRLEVALSAEWILSPVLSLEGEIVGSTGGFSGRPGTPGGFGSAENNLEGLIGIAERFGRHLKLEQGIVIVSDGSWQAVIAWEWAFGRD
jgi:hypothetical protein